MYVDGHVDIFDMIDIDLFSVIALNMMVVQLDHGVTTVNSYQRPSPHVRATMEDITEPDSSASIETRSEKMLLLTCHDSNAPIKESVCDFVTPKSLPQHDSSTPCKDSVCESVTPRCMPHATASHVIEDVIRQLSFEETELDGEAGFGDVAEDVGRPQVPVSNEADFGRTQEHIVEQVIVKDYVSYEEGVEQGNGQEVVEASSDEQFFYDVKGIDNAYETQYYVESSEDICAVPNDVLKREDVDVINPDGFDSDPGNDNETSNHRRRRLAELSRKMKCVMNSSGQWKRNLKLYKNDSVKVRARCDGKVFVFIMSQGTRPTGPNQGMEARVSGSSGPSTMSKKRKNTCTDDDNQGCSSALDTHDKGDLYPWVMYVGKDKSKK
uniref:Uncharacterized protein n=1 Tax=Tanacetum cinerariifolium TaxID=118510 RepID=A0A6L2KYY1_TANCI|nr:hypothetical protein [Tanacetum cinerariifolium]